MIAIDFGTSNTRAAVVRNTTGQVEIIPNDKGHSATPTYVTWDSVTGEVIVGRDAKQQALLQPKDTAFDFKQLLGRSFDSKEVQSAITQLPYTIVDRDNKPFIQVEMKGETREFSVEDVTAMVLTKMKEFAETYLGEEIENTVVTVPASFEDAQREAMKAACAMAGLTTRRVMNEPTAVVVAFGIDRKSVERKVLVVHFDGGALDATLLEIDEGIVEVLVTKSHRIGDEVTQRVMDHCISQWKYDKHVDISTDPRMLQRLRLEAERVQHALSEQTEAVVTIESSSGSAVLTQSFSRATLETMTRDLAEPLVEIVEIALMNGGVAKQEVDGIVFAGGASRIPMLRQLMVERFGWIELQCDVDEEEVVVHGAAAIADIIHGQAVDATAELNILPWIVNSLGVETAGGVMLPVLSRHRLTPTRATQTVSTLHANQLDITIRVFEGERLLTKDNHFIGQLRLSGLAPAPQGVPRIEVEFETDAMGETLFATARVEGTNLADSLTIQVAKHAFEHDEAVRKAGEDAKDEDTKVKARIERYLSRDRTASDPSDQDAGWSDVCHELSTVVDGIVAIASEPVAPHEEL